MAPRLFNKIISVYQPKYARNEVCTGLGDYIRGSLALLQFAALEGLDFYMDYSKHPIARWLQKHVDDLVDVDADAVTEKEPLMLLHPFRVVCHKDSHTFIASVRELKNMYRQLISKNLACVQYEAFPVYSIAYPVFNSDNIDQTRNWLNVVRNALMPVNELARRIDARLACLGVSAGGYNVIHLRTGDNFLISGEVSDFSLAIECKRVFLDTFSAGELKRGYTGLPFVLIADNVELKQQLKRAFPCLRVACKTGVTHFGEGVELEGDEDAVADTLVDFFVMARSAGVWAFSALGHGTGFSEWCCRLYDVPYVANSLLI